MRIILVFAISFLSFFYIAEILWRLSRKIRYSILGITFMLSGLVSGFFLKTYLAEGLNVLVAFSLLGSGLGLTLHHLLSQRFILFEKKTF